MKRETVSSAIELAGAAAIVVGAALMMTAAGWIVGGLFGLLFSWRLNR